jgi:hypothetical protein
MRDFIDAVDGADLTRIAAAVARRADRRRKTFDQRVIEGAAALLRHHTDPGDWTDAEHLLFDLAVLIVENDYPDTTRVVATAIHRERVAALKPL